MKFGILFFHIQKSLGRSIIRCISERACLQQRKGPFIRDASQRCQIILKWLQIS